MTLALALDSVDIALPVRPRVRIQVMHERDGRHRSKMNEETKRVDALLVEWARWGKNALAHLGLPRETLDARVARLGFTGAAQAGPMPEWPPVVILTEKAVLKIKQIQRSVIVEEYMNPDVPREVHARRRNMTPNGYAKVLERARHSIRSELLALSYTFT